MRTGRLLLVGCLLLTLTNSSAAPLSGDQGLPRLVDGQTTQRGTGRVLIDGKNNPELINRDALVAQILGAHAMSDTPDSE